MSRSCSGISVKANSETLTQHKSKYLPVQQPSFRPQPPFRMPNQSQIQPQMQPHFNTNQPRFQRLHNLQPRFQNQNSQNLNVTGSSTWGN